MVRGNCRSLLVLSACVFARSPVALNHPIGGKKASYKGALSLLFKPADLVGPIVEPQLKDPGLLCWIVQTDGCMVYDR